MEHGSQESAALKTKTRQASKKTQTLFLLQFSDEDSDQATSAVAGNCQETPPRKNLTHPRLSSLPSPDFHTNFSEKLQGLHSNSRCTNLR
jgi:hypothetical protein